MQPIDRWLGLPQATLASSSLGQIMVLRATSRRRPDPTDTPSMSGR